MIIPTSTSTFLGQECDAVVDAICNGTIELNDLFIAKFAGHMVWKALSPIHEAERAYRLARAIDREEVSFRSRSSVYDDAIIVPIHESATCIVGERFSVAAKDDAWKHWALDAWRGVIPPDWRQQLDDRDIEPKEILGLIFEQPYDFILSGDKAYYYLGGYVIVPVLIEKI